MSLTPGKHDMEAGYTRTLIAVAVRHFPHVPSDEVPWPDWGSTNIPVPYEVDSWLRHLPDWDYSDVNYILYLVPSEEYRPLNELHIKGVSELDIQEFLATEGEVATVHAMLDGKV